MKKALFFLLFSLSEFALSDVVEGTQSPKADCSIAVERIGIPRVETNAEKLVRAVGIQNLGSEDVPSTFEQIQAKFPDVIEQMRKKKIFSETDINTQQVQVWQARSFETGFPLTVMRVRGKDYYLTSEPDKVGFMLIPKQVRSFFPAPKKWGVLNSSNLTGKQGTLFYLHDGQALKIKYDAKTRKFDHILRPQQGTQVVEIAIQALRIGDTRAQRQAEMLQLFQRHLGNLVDEGLLKPEQLTRLPFLTIMRERTGQRYLAVQTSDLLRNGYDRPKRTLSRVGGILDGRQYYILGEIDRMGKMIAAEQLKAMGEPGVGNLYESFYATNGDNWELGSELPSSNPAY